MCVISNYKKVVIVSNYNSKRVGDWIKRLGCWGGIFAIANEFQQASINGNDLLKLDFTADDINSGSPDAKKKVLNAIQKFKQDFKDATEKREKLLQEQKIKQERVKELFSRVCPYRLMFGRCKHERQYMSKFARCRLDHSKVIYEKKFHITTPLKSIYITKYKSKIIGEKGENIKKLEKSNIAVKYNKSWTGFVLRSYDVNELNIAAAQFKLIHEQALTAVTQEVRKHFREIHAQSKTNRYYEQLEKKFKKTGYPTQYDQKETLIRGRHFCKRPNRVTRTGQKSKVRQRRFAGEFKKSKISRVQKKREVLEVKKRLTLRIQRKSLVC